MVVGETLELAIILGMVLVGLSIMVLIERLTAEPQLKGGEHGSGSDETAKQGTKQGEGKV